MSNIINTFYISVDNDVTHWKIFTLSKLLVIFYTLKYGEFITYSLKSFMKNNSSNTNILPICIILKTHLWTVMRWFVSWPLASNKDVQYKKWYYKLVTT